jgi:hypothetical protein
MATAMRTLIVLGVVLLLVPASRAADPAATQADELISEGFKLRIQGKNIEALDLFVKAHALAPSGKTLGQMGSVEVALHRWVDAEAHIDQALARHDSPWIEAPKNREMLQQTLAEARRQIARIQLRGTPGAEVHVDGRLAGVLPLAEPIHVAAGKVRITAAEAGFQPEDKELVTVGGNALTVDLNLNPVASPSAIAPAALLTQPARSEGRRPTWRKWTGSSLLTGGVAAIGVGVGWLVVDGRPTCDAPSGAVCGHLYDTKTQGWVAVGLGVAAAGAGAALLLWPSKQSAVAVRVGPGSLALAGRF